MARRKRYPGYIEKRGNSFRISLCVDGVRHKFTVATKDRAEAARAAETRYRQLAERAKRRAVGLPGAVLFSELLREFEDDRLPQLSPNTQEAYRGSLAFIREFFVDLLEDPFIDQLHAAHVQRFLDWRKVRRRGPGKGPVSNRTVARDRAVLHRLFSIAERLEYRDGNPVGRVEAPKADPRQPVILTDGEFEALLEACEGRPMLRLFVLTANETGARSESEVLQLQWEDVDLEDGFLHIVSGREGHRTKSGRSRWTPMTARLRQAMKAHFAAYRFAAYDGRPTPWVFHHLRTRRRYKAGERIQSLYDSFKGAAKRANLPASLRVHDLRHRRATTWLAQGKNPVHVKEALGHADIRTTLGYTHLVPEHLRSLVEPSPDTAESRKELRELQA